MRHFVSAACGLWLAAMAQVQAEPVVVVAARNQPDARRLGLPSVPVYPKSIHSAYP